MVMFSQSVLLLHLFCCTIISCTVTSSELFQQFFQSQQMKTPNVLIPQNVEPKQHNSHNAFPLINTVLASSQINDQLYVNRTTRFHTTLRTCLLYCIIPRQGKTQVCEAGKISLSANPNH
jgi:hypothetical protein